MVNFEQIKILLQTAGISLLTVKFDEPNRLLNITYVFRGKQGEKQLTYDQVENSLKINAMFQQKEG